MDSGSPYHWQKDMTLENRGLLLAHLLNACAKYIESGSITNADMGLARISHLASSDGDSMQRVATYFSEALSCLAINKSFRGACAVLSKPFSTAEELLAKKLFFELYPVLKIAHAITNQAIIEVAEELESIHILDLGAPHDATQWILLMHSLKERRPTRPPPYLKITCVHEKQQVLEQIGLHLKVEAEKMNFSLEFHAIVSTLENLDLEKLPIEKGEPIAISIVLQLHSLLATDDPIPTSSSSSMHHQRTFEEILIGKHKKVSDQSPVSSLSPPAICPSPKMECFLYGLWRLQPRVMVITEQESSVNVCTLTERVDKALHFYGALFDCLESTIPKTIVAERILLERVLLGEQIRNIIACEGAQRKERHERLRTWIPRLELAGFGRVPISFEGMLHASKLLQNYGHGYNILRENKCLFICREDTPLFSISAWRF